MPKSAVGVLGAMLDLAHSAKEAGYGDGRSCWASNGAVAELVGLKSERQVRNIRRAIEARGWLRRDDKVGPSDPIDPRNRTGERWYFAWKTGEMPPRDPAEVPPERARVGRPPGSRKLISSPPGHPPESPETDPRAEINFRDPRQFISPNVDLNSTGDGRTLNVETLAGPGDGEATTDAAPIATVEALPAAEGTPPAAPAAPAASPEARRNAAYRLAGELLGTDRHRRFRDLRPRVDESGEIRWTAPPGAGPLPSAEELALIERLRPEFLAELASRGFKAPARPTATPLAGEGSDRPAADGKPAPKVPPAVQADVRSRIARLRLPETPRADVAETARVLADALGPHENPGLTVATFLGLAGDVRKGVLAEACLQEAFEEACGRKAESRGAVFIAAVKRWKQSSGRGTPPAHSSP
jgi:hypothetical protein